jgi:alpha-glucosidase
VIYQVYPRSFADGNGDGVGDIAGLRARLGHLCDLGVDALWINPWYRSPMHDGGYDISDHCDIDPVFGTLDDARGLIADAHALGLRIILDLVPNHTSAGHPWFTAALAATPGSPERRRYLFRDGRGPDGAVPPNDWISAFGGPAWTRTTDVDGRPGQWYLHLFAPQQPDLNWDDEHVRADFAEVLRFWLGLGVDGLRVDAAPALAKAPGLPDAGFAPGDPFAPVAWVDSPFWDVDGVHEIFRSWRKLVDGYPGDRMLVGEVPVNGSARLARYVRPDELHTAFNLDYLKTPWDPAHLRAVIDDSLTGLATVEAVATWVLGNHDEVRHVTRLGRPDTAVYPPGTRPAQRSDLALGTRRARAAILLTLALPGSVYLYQGEELGLWEVEDLPEDVLQDPTWLRSGRTLRGRDGCRVPLPWHGEQPPFGFALGVDDVTPWLPQPAAWAALTVQAETGDPDSMLELYRSALRIRREHPQLATAALVWEPAPDGVLLLGRGPHLRCTVNMSGAPVRCEGKVLLSSHPLVDGALPVDAAAWLSLSS